MDSTAAKNCERRTNGGIGESASVSEVAALVPPRQHEQLYQMRQKGEEDEDDIIEVGSDSDDDEGSRSEFDFSLSMQPSSRYDEDGLNPDGSEMDVQQRQESVALADPIMAHETEISETEEDRRRIGTSLAVHFGEEEEEEEEEDDMTGSYVRKKVGTRSDLLCGNRSWSRWCVLGSYCEKAQECETYTLRCYSHGIDIVPVQAVTKLQRELVMW